MNEERFETKLIHYLSTGTEFTEVNEPTLKNYLPKKLWKYEPQIKTLDDLWFNFKQILESHNQNILNGPLSYAEFDQVIKVIEGLETPYQAGQFLYGFNGVSQIEVDLDDGRHVFLTVFDQKQVGAGDTVYQVVNQIESPARITGKPKRRFDTTLLINGLPIIQIEEKTDKHDVNEALNQMHQYIAENQYRGIFSTLQILVAISPDNAKYMANTTADKFNKDFAFNWQRQEDNKIVRHWKEFADSMLSIPMAHQMATNYMILDGTKNKQMLKVMRPYQVYATQKVLEGLKRRDLEASISRIGYIWHTTGSGKTITSFKTAWLASRLPNVDKVVFVVDRIALTRQTNENYRAYDPDATEDVAGIVQDTNNTHDLSHKLKTKENSIIVTSVQKLAKLVKQAGYKPPQKKIVFIVDEAHRSTGGESFELIQKAFKHSAWVGYTGTPMFDDTTKGLRTQDIFGPLLHAYTIREAIADRNVLGFKVDFETTIPMQEIKDKYLPTFYRERYPSWDEEKIQNKINNLSPEDMDDALTPSFYDENPQHVALVVQDIFTHWRNRSNECRYNALFTTHVGGGKASTPMALMYFKEFQRVNAERQKEGKPTLKVAVTFSMNSSNNDFMVDANEGLHEAINVYNAQFGTKFGLHDASAYTQDVMSRLNRTASDKQYLDLVIVVDQLLTGFDAPQLNTLYVDRTLKEAGLIQAYSRTNRVADMLEKPWGRVVNYRWPTQNERLMNEALAIYANKESANLSDEARSRQNVEDGITAPPFHEVLDQVKDTVQALRVMTDDFNRLPASETEKEAMWGLLQDYSAGMAKLKQCTPENGQEKGFDYDNPEALLKELNMTPEQESTLTTVLKNELKDHVAKKKNIPPYQLELRMVHIKDVKINYDYLTKLLEDLLNEIHAQQEDKAKETKEKITKFANSLDDRGYASQIMNATTAIMNGHYPEKDSGFTYPAKLTNSDSIIQEANAISLDRIFLDFRVKWGLTEIITSAQMREWFSHHRYEAQDLDEMGQLDNLKSQACENYKTLAHDPDVQKLTKMKYRNALVNAIYELADQLAVN